MHVSDEGDGVELCNLCERVGAGGDGVEMSNL